MSTVRIQLRRGTAADWTSINPVLAAGEAGYESDTKKIKIGDGSSNWTTLSYATITPSELAAAVANGIGSQLTASDVNTALGYTAANAADLSGLSSQTSTDITNAISTAEGYTDTAVGNEAADRTLAINIAKSYAITQSELYTDQAITTEASNRDSAITTAVNNLVNGAPGLLNTLGEIATALQSDESTATTLASTVAGKVSKAGDTMSGELAMGNHKVSGVATPTATGDAATKGYVDAGLLSVQTSSGNYTDTQVATEATNRISAVTAAISTAESYADNKFAPKNSPTFTGTITAPQNSLDGLTINDLSITTTKLHDSSVTSPKIASGSVTNDKIVDGTIEGDKIKNATISSDKIISVSKDKVTDLYDSASFSGTTVLPNTTSIGLVTGTEIGYVHGVTSSIQNQLDSNATSASNNATEISNHESLTHNVHGISDTAALATKTYADSSSSAAAASAVTTSEGYTDGKIATEVTNRNSAIATSLSTAEGYTDSAISTEVTNRNSAISSAVSTETSNRATAVTAAISTAEAFATAADSTLHTAITGEIATAKSQAISSAGTYTDNAISNLVNGAPSTLDTLAEIASALGSDANLSTTLTNSIALKAPLASPTFTGTVTLPAGTVTSGMILDGTIATTDIADSAITSAKIADSAVTSAKIADGTIVDADINATAAIATSKISGLDTALAAKLSSATASTTYAPIASPTFTGTVSGITKSMVGLSNVDNTADSSKPVSTATQTALDLKLASATAATTYETIANVALKAPLASPALTGTPTAPTATAGTNTTQLATTAFVGTAVANLVNGAPAILDTLGEIATALQADESAAATLTTLVGTKAPLASPTFTGTVTLPLTTAGYVTTTSGGVVSSAATIPNSGLTNSSTTIGTTAISLGASSTTLAGLTSVTSTGFTGALTGNADTATKLATARNINGVAFDGSAAITITAANPNALTIGTGLSGTSYTGSGAVTIAIDSTVATLTGTQTLTNKTLTSPVIGTISNTGTLTLPTSTDTLVGRATTDTLTNKTFDTAGAGNVLKINGTQVSAVTGTGAVVLATSPSVTGLSTDTLSTTGNVTVGGNLTVNGTTTTINSTTLNTTEQVLVISNTATPTDVTANGAGITIKGATDKTIKWYSSTGAVTFSENIDLASGKTYKINGTDVLTATAVGGRTIPASNIVGLTDTQTLTNKTLTSPAMTTPTVSSGTLTVAAAGVTFSDATVQTTAGVPSVTPIDNTTFATGTVNLATGFKDYMFKVGASTTVTLQQDSAATYPVGTSIDFYANGTGAAFAAGTGATIINTPGLKFRAVGSVATAMKVAANTWLVFGDLSA